MECAWTAAPRLPQCFLWPRLWRHWSDVFTTPTMRELRRRHFDDRGSAPLEDSYSHLLGTPMEPSAGNILQTIGAHRQKRYQQEASRIQGSCLLWSRQGQVHRDSEPQGGRHLRVSPPVQVERAGAATPGLPNTVILPPVSEAEHAGSQHKPCRRQKSAEQKAAEHAKECLRCHQLGCYEVDCPHAADEPMGMPRLRWPQWRSPLFPVNRDVLSRNLPLFLRKRPPDLLRQVQRGSVSGRTGSTCELRSCGYSAAFTTGHGGYESQPDLVICHVQGLTVEAAASDSHGSGQAGQLSVMQLTAATRWPGSCSESCERGWCWASLGSEAPFPTTLTTSSLIWWWREAMFQTLKWHIDLMKWGRGLIGVPRLKSGAVLDFRGSDDGYLDQDICRVRPGIVLWSASSGFLQGWCCLGGAAPLSIMAMPQDGRLFQFPLAMKGCLTDASVASGWPGQASGPAQGQGRSRKTQASPSFTTSRATPDYSRCQYRKWRFVESCSHTL